MRNIATLVQAAFLLATISFARAAPPASKSNCNQAAAIALTNVELPGHPFSIATTPDGCWLFASLTSEDPKSNGVAVLRRASGQITLERVYPIAAEKGRPAQRPGPSGMVMTHDGKLLIVANDDEILFLDVQAMISGKLDPIVERLSDGPGAGSFYVNVTRDDEHLFVSDEHAKTISVIDLKKARIAVLSLSRILIQAETSSDSIRKLSKK